MSSRAKRKARSRHTSAILEYYQPVFLLIHRDLAATDSFPRRPHSIRDSFWHLIPQGEYDPQQGRNFLLSYRSAVEQELNKILATHCISYWLHAYRRLSPGPIGEDKRPMTILWVRANLEASVQKYASLTECDGIARSDTVDEKNILSGALMHPDFKMLRDGIRQARQLVLTKFDSSSMRQLYEAETLAYELWRIGAALRIVGKGAGLIVANYPGNFFDNRSEELAELVEHFDNRPRKLDSSATGTVFSNQIEKTGIILLPRYDVERTSKKALDSILKKFKWKINSDFVPNFVWLPFNLRGYARAHLPFAKDFELLHKVPLASVLAVIGAVALETLSYWYDAPERIIQYWQRAYAGPWLKTEVQENIEKFIPISAKAFELEVTPNSVDVSAVMGFLGLDQQKRESISTVLGGPHSLFIPHADDRCFVDLAWIVEILRNLFFKVNPSDQNFKGDALEKYVNLGNSVLPTKALKAQNNQSKQVDAAFGAGDVLVIVECKANGMSFGIELGDPSAIRYRKQLIEKALDEADTKARWLASNPVGRNYDISKYSRILPVAVTPFVEFIPSLKSYYWIKPRLPRVLSPSELNEVVLRTDLHDAQNLVAISK
jgi:hypothetical protein